MMAADDDCDLVSHAAGQHPLVLRAYFGNHICLETLVILDVLLNFCADFDQSMRRVFMWPETSRLIRKYRPFLKFDADAFRKIYHEKFPAG
jgi:hypothetical protein